ncbi:MAG: hypothetical protein COY68_04355 [Candidatus Levybacteria bacterium CG_4_10_14_0_8_um_filter_35_23]|nr:MAG: hypothetical protein COY68_04355 [Candidatus Levybacteria bacterium CG_4_10_14_0_8_um_filter_35_23]
MGLKNNFINKINKNGAGFTLVELLVVIGILLILLALTLLIINPLTQLKKIRDSERKHDLLQIRNALDTYYNDHACYPASVPFGEKWLDGNVILMQKVPQEHTASCLVSGSCYYYYYQTDPNDSCPQWAILYAKLEITPVAAEHCGRKIIRTMCPGTAFNGKYNYCLSAGQINCTSLSQSGTAGPYLIVPSPTPTPGPTYPPETPTPSPTPGNYACTCDPNEYPGKKLYDFRPACNELFNNPPYKYCDDNCTQPCNPNY